MPLLYFGLAICLAFKLFADGIKFTNIHGWDLEGSGRLFETVLERCQLGTLIPHLLLMNQCFFSQLWRTLGVNVIIIIYVIVLQVFMYKNRAANLQAIMRIIGKIEFQKTTSRDVANWVYRYSHPYVRVLGPKKATLFMNDICLPNNLEALSGVQQSKDHPQRFNLPISDSSPTKSIRKDLVDQKDEQEFGSNPKFSNDPYSSSRKNLDYERRISAGGSIGKAISPEDLSSLKLESPLHAKDDHLSFKSEGNFGSNSHFRKDGHHLDLAASPVWKEIEKSALEFNSLNGINLKVIEERKDDSQFEIDRALNQEDEPAEGEIPQHHQPHDHKIWEGAHKADSMPLKGSSKLMDPEQKPTLIDVRRNKIVSPIPLTLSRKNKSEGRVSMLSMKKMLQADKINTENQDDNSKDILSVPKKGKPEERDDLTSHVREELVGQDLPLNSAAHLVQSNDQ